MCLAIAHGILMRDQREQNTANGKNTASAVCLKQSSWLIVFTHRSRPRGLLVQRLALGVGDFDLRTIRIARIVGLVIMPCVIPEVVITRLNFIQHVTKRHPWTFSNRADLLTLQN